MSFLKIPLCNVVDDFPSDRIHKQIPIICRRSVLAIVIVFVCGMIQANAATYRLAIDGVITSRNEYPGLPLPVIGSPGTPYSLHWDINDNVVPLTSAGEFVWWRGPIEAFGFATPSTTETYADNGGLNSYIYVATEPTRSYYNLQGNAYGVTSTYFYGAYMLLHGPSTLSLEDIGQLDPRPLSQWSSESPNYALFTTCPTAGGGCSAVIGTVASIRYELVRADPVDEIDPGPGEARLNPATGHFYEVVEGTWAEAEAQGIAKGGHLVTINDAAEQQWLVGTFNMSFPETTPNGVDTKVAYWIGLSDREVEGQFRWTNGESLAETGFGADFASPPWAPLEPSDNDGGGNSEDDVAMNFRICDYAPTFFGCTDYPQANDPGLWNDFGGAGDFLRYGIIEYPPPQWSIDPRSTFLLTDPADSPQPPLVIDLVAAGIAPGQLVRIVQKGDYSAATSGEFSADAFGDLVAVFSGSATVLDPAEIARVPDAIDAGEDYVSYPAGSGELATDIPEDFRVFPEAVVVVPVGATHLILGVQDSFYADNSDPDGDFGVDVIAYPAVSADPSVTIGANPTIGEGTVLNQQVVIGDNVVIGAGVQVSMGSTIGDDVHIGDSTTLNQGSTVGDGSDIGSNVIVGKYVTILENVSIGDGTQIGQGAVICAGAQIGTNVVVGKNVLIQTGAVVADGTSLKAQKTAPSPASCNEP